MCRYILKVNNVYMIKVFVILSVFMRLLQLIKCQSCRLIETSQLICRANQLIGFYMMATLAFSSILLIRSEHLSGVHKYENNDKSSFLMYNPLISIIFFLFKSHEMFLSTVSQPAFICLKCTIKKTRIMCEICSKLTINTPK